MEVFPVGGREDKRNGAGGHECFGTLSADGFIEAESHASVYINAGDDPLALSHVVKLLEDVVKGLQSRSSIEKR